MAILAGASLSISGLLMQTIFRNPLAGPYVLGISSGASLGVAITVLGASSLPFLAYFTGNWAVAISGVLGSGIVLIIVLSMASKVNDIMTILILGLMFGSGISAVVSILQYFSNSVILKNYILWTLGSLSSTTSSQIQILFPIIAITITATFFLSKTLNAMYLGEETAKSMGVNIKLTRLIIFSLTSVLTGLITAFCGPIGFIGIAIPHIARIFFKTANHNILIPGTIFMGAVLMLISDIISQVPGYNIIIPINSVTALIGIPVIFWIILKKKRI